MPSGEQVAQTSSLPIRVVILGAGGRDFHNFNVYFRGRPGYRVVAFTAAQIPNIADRRYPPVLAGEEYPEGIPIVSEEALDDLVRDAQVDQVVFAYSDVSHEHVMHLASRALAAGAGFRLLGPKETMLRARVPVVSVGAVRTGSGKSQTARVVARLLQAQGRRVVVVRHPMAYGDLAAQAVQRFATPDDLDAAGLTVEEREEYEPHIARGIVVYAGVDYAEVLQRAQAEADVLVWDGGNNDFPFFWPDRHIVVADPHRAGHELRYHPGETNLRMADVVVINKVDSAPPGAVATLRRAVAAANPRAVVMEAASPIAVDRPDLVAGRNVVVVEDGPTTTHGEMAYGAGLIAAERLGARVVDPRPYAVGSLQAAYAAYPHLARVVPALGYGDAQRRDLEETLRRVPADAVVIGTPVDLRRVLVLDKPAVRVTYDLDDATTRALADLLAAWAVQWPPLTRPATSDA
ncbi:MAG: cyclic 2,3-diphosphoglycerate synthase [Armatimonadota bacterium]|nr:cyclic 2,3-diphosphoglycerate synthase [Armatimonadota bacterium]MDR7485466.1 cyclic 2,3-diphosphoglycerate synthase [Armatimonadota bacterium]MDR7533011.1 cyclic 2,3-diphosphoglycerate synthase [Armatimonadota bacterium]MDR7536817.1 cyclic 2,3-diphosphoglycerate synthase [Armatimonadota bacterium]